MSHIPAHYLLSGAVEEIDQGMGVSDIGLVYGIIIGLSARSLHIKAPAYIFKDILRETVSRCFEQNYALLAIGDGIRGY